MAVYTRSTGLFLTIIPAYSLINSTLKKCSFCQFIKNAVFLTSIVVMVAITYLAITFYTPYQIHCMSRLESEEDAPTWCYD